VKILARNLFPRPDLILAYFWQVFISDEGILSDVVVYCVSHYSVRVATAVHVFKQ